MKFLKFYLNFAIAILFFFTGILFATSFIPIDKNNIKSTEEVSKSTIEYGRVLLLKSPYNKKQIQLIIPSSDGTIAVNVFLHIDDLIKLQNNIELLIKNKE